MESGNFLYNGMTGFGKTWKLEADMRAENLDVGRPTITFDLGNARHYREKPGNRTRASTAEEALQLLYQRKTNVLYTPARLTHFDWLIKKIRRVGGVLVALDDIRMIASRRVISEELCLALLEHRQGLFGPVTYRATIQGIAQVHPDFFRCLTGGIFTFRTIEKTDLDELERFHPGKGDRIMTLGVGEFEQWIGGQ